MVPVGIDDVKDTNTNEIWAAFSIRQQHNILGWLCKYSAKANTARNADHTTNNVHQLHSVTRRPSEAQVVASPERAVLRSRCRFWCRCGSYQARDGKQVVMV